jgi:hypothetical protein
MYPPPSTTIKKENKQTNNIHLEAQKTANSQGNTEQKRATLQVSQYLTSNYTTEA